MTEFRRLVFEEVERLGGTAHAGPIRAAVSARSGSPVSHYRIGEALTALWRDGWLWCRWGDGSPERDWRARQYYGVAQRPEEER